MRTKHAFYAAMLVVSGGISSAWADDLRAAMEANNARWLAAYNTRNTAAFPAMYTTDAMVLPPGAPPAVGREAIGQFWENWLKKGNRKDHTFEIVSLREDGKQAYQVARWTVVVVKENGESTRLSGNTVRIFEHQPDGVWLTKVHIFNIQQ